MSGRKIIDGLRDAVRGRFGRVTIVRVRKIAINGVERDMTPEEEAAFDDAFNDLGRSFDKLSDVFGKIKP